MLYLLDLVQESYSQVMAIINFICFGAFFACCVFFYVAVVIGIFDYYTKHVATTSLIVIITLLITHFVMLDNLGIPLIVPPIGTIYFTEFIHVMQYIASIAVVVLLACIFLLALLSRFDRRYQHQFVSAFLMLVVIGMLHVYILDNFGIPLIYPPNLW